MLNLRKVSLTIMIILLLTFITACTPSSNTEEEITNLDRNVTNILDSDESEEVALETEDNNIRETVEEQVLLDQDDIKITLKSLDFDGFYGPELKVLIENNSDKSIIVQTRDSSVNDIMIETMFSCNVAAGKKANDSIDFMRADFEQAGIATIQNIEFKFHIFDSDKWDVILDSDTITVNTTADPSYVQAYDDSGLVVLDDKDIKIVMKRVSSTESFWGADVYVYIENNSDKDVTIQARDVSINGFMIDPIFSSDVLSGKKAYDTITFFESDLADNDIKSIDIMELSFHIFDSNSWDTYFDTQLIEVTFE